MSSEAFTPQHAGGGSSEPAVGPADHPAGAAAQPAKPQGGTGFAVQSPMFAQLEDATGPVAGSSLARFYDVRVTVTAELGRVTLPIGELLNLGEGSTLELGRPVSAPVDLVAQGVRIARGEVVVIDDCFAIRIKEIDSGKKPADQEG